MTTMDRRSFLRTTSVAAGGLALGSSFWASACAAPAPGSPAYGPLGAPDVNGIRLPREFRSRVVAKTGSVVAGTAFVWHQSPDGGACFTVPGSPDFVYVSNSETAAVGGGGASALRLGQDGTVKSAYRILAGTQVNCAGGPTPWGTWLSGEEFPGGQMWECDPLAPSQGVARPALGFFSHEAAAVDPVRRHVYLTEDRPDGRLYRFSPTRWPDLVAGRLEVARLSRGGSFVASSSSATSGTLTWMTVSDGLVGAVQPRPTGSTAFDGCEGIWFDSGSVYFTTKGENRLYRLQAATGSLTVLYDAATSPTPTLTGVDNVTVNRAHEIFVAEDGGNMQLNVFGADRRLGPFLQIEGQEDSEITGPAFSPDGNRLFLSSQRGAGGLPGAGIGITYEVAGPFHTW